MFWSTEVGGTAACPQCGSRLEAEHHTYVLLVREGGNFDSFVAGNDDGHFCPACPTVVLDHEAFSRFASLGTGLDRGDFLVPGLVDLEAVPEDKRHVPLGEDDNPIPLVQFTNYRAPRSRSARARRRRQKLRRDRRKRKRT